MPVTKRLPPSLEFSACVFSRFSRVWLFATLWTVACQAPLSMGFSRQKYQSRLPCAPPRDLSNPGTEPTSVSPALQVDSLPTEPPRKPLEFRAKFKGHFVHGDLTWSCSLQYYQLSMSLTSFQLTLWVFSLDPYPSAQLWIFLSQLGKHSVLLILIQMTWFWILSIESPSSGWRSPCQCSSEIWYFNVAPVVTSIDVTQKYMCVSDTNFFPQ